MTNDEIRAQLDGTGRATVSEGDLRRLLHDSDRLAGVVLSMRASLNSLLSRVDHVIAEVEDEG